MRLGSSEKSQNEHNTMRLVYLDVSGPQDLPDRFRYLGRPWLYMFRSEIYAEDEYIEYLERNPTHNLLMTNLGLVNLSETDPEGHLNYLKDTNLPIYQKNADEKKKQSQKGKEKNEAKRKAEATPLQLHKLLQSVALVAQWPIPLRQRHVAVLILQPKAHARKTRSTLESGRNTMEYGIKRWFAMGAPNWRSTKRISSSKSA